MLRRREVTFHVALLALVAAFSVYVARGQWFYGDEWDFLLFRGIFGTHKLGLLTPHNEHWSTLPILGYRAAFAFVGLRSYWPYMAMLIAIHVACVHFVWRILRRTQGVTPEMAFAAAAILGFFGAGWEDLLWAFQIGFVGSVAAGLALVLAVDGDPTRRRTVAIATGAIASLMISGLSVVMVGVLGLVALVKWGWTRAIAVTVPAGITYLVWLERYGQQNLDQQSNLHGTLADAPAYVWGGIVGTVHDSVGGPRALSVVLVIALAVSAVVCLRSLIKVAPEALALAVGAVMLFGLISQGRAAVVDPATSRYLYISGALLLPLFAVMGSKLTRRWNVTRVIGLVAALAVVFNGATFLRDRSVGERNIDLGMRGQLIAALELADSGVRILSDEPQSPFAPDVSIADLRSLRARGRLYETTVNARDRAAAQLALQSKLTKGASQRPLGAAFAVDTRGVTVTPGTNGCAQVTGAGQAMFVRLAARNALTVSVDQTSLVQFLFKYDAGFAGPRRVFAEPRQTYTFLSDLEGELAIVLDKGVVTMCGIDWTTQNRPG